jgi:predicted RNA-binding protein with TRAM domain
MADPVDESYELEPVPVKENEIHDVRIDSVGNRGDGITHFGHFIVFVPKAVIGNRYEVKITKVHSTFAHAEIIKKLAIR